METLSRSFFRSEKAHAKRVSAAALADDIHSSKCKQRSSVGAADRCVKHAGGSWSASELFCKYAMRAMNFGRAESAYNYLEAVYRFVENAKGTGGPGAFCVELSNLQAVLTTRMQSHFLLSFVRAKVA